MKVVIPMRLPSLANARLHHHAKARLVAAQRLKVGWYLRTLGDGRELGGELAVLLVRVAPKPLDDDNLAGGACKPARDEVAAWLGLPDDRDPRVSWLYDQRRGAKGEHALEVVITRRARCEHCGAVRIWGEVERVTASVEVRA